MLPPSTFHRYLNCKLCLVLRNVRCKNCQLPVEAVSNMQKTYFFTRCWIQMSLLQDRTLHILTRYISKERKANVNLENMRTIHLAKFLEKHEEWCETVAYNYLQVKQKTWKQFKAEWLHESFTLNMVGIFIWARAYHRHVAVFFGYNYWTSHIDHDLNKVHIFLLYRGNNRFDETCMIGGMEYHQHYNKFSRRS